MKGLLLDDACNPVGSCLTISTSETTPTVGERIDATGPSGGDHFFVVDGLEGGRGTGTVSLICN